MTRRVSLSILLCTLAALTAQAQWSKQDSIRLQQLLKTLLSNLFSPILTLSKESKIIYEKQTPENYIMFISSMLHL